MIESLRHAVRALRRDPILWSTATFTLALCIGANTTVFSLVNSILLRPLPFPDSGRIYWVSERLGKSQAEVGLGADYYSLREAHRLFADVGPQSDLSLTLAQALADPVDAPGVGKRQRTQQNRVDQAEYGGIRADTQGQCEGGRRPKDRIAAQRANRVA